MSDPRLYLRVLKNSPKFVLNSIVLVTCLAGILFVRVVVPSAKGPSPRNALSMVLIHIFCVDKSLYYCPVFVFIVPI